MIAEARLDKAVAYFKELRDRHPHGGGLALELAAAAYQIPRPRLSAAMERDAITNRNKEASRT